MQMLNSVDQRKQLLGFLAAFFLGGVLLFAAYAKLIEPAGFLDQINLEGFQYLYILYNELVAKEHNIPDNHYLNNNSMKNPKIIRNLHKSLYNK